MTIERRPITDRERWLGWRPAFLTASVLSAVVPGIRHPYTSELRLYVEKRGVEFPPVEDNAVLRRGRWLEPAFPKMVAEKRPEWTIKAPNVFVCDTVRKIAATPDFEIMGDPRGPGILETKTAAPSVIEREWDNGREISGWIVVQALIAMHLCGANFCAVAVLVVDPFQMDCIVLEVPPQPELLQRCLDSAATFWRNVEQGIEPPADYAKDTDVIRALTARATAGKTFDATGHNELPTLLAQRAALCARIKADELRCTEIENEVKLLMGDAESMVGLDGWRVSFRVVNVPEYTVKARSSRQLRITDKRPLHERPQADEAA